MLGTSVSDAVVHFSKLRGRGKSHVDINIGADARCDQSSRLLLAPATPPTQILHAKERVLSSNARLVSASAAAMTRKYASLAAYCTIDEEH
jgi:hypothetical protein